MQGQASYETQINGALWSDPRLTEVTWERDIILFMETHQSEESGLPRVEGYYSEYA